jgi:hypothetical protein
MKVLLTLYGDSSTWETDPEQIERAFTGWQAYDEAARRAGVLIACDGLAPGHAATTIRVRNGRRQVTDGPFMETKEQLGGYVLLEVADLDEAMEWADRLPWNHEGCATEIRPILDYEAMAARAGMSSGESAAS